MDKSDLKLLFDYNDWANARVLAACRDLSDEQMRVPMNCSFTNLMGTLAHIYGAELFWRRRLQEGVSPTVPLPTGADFPSLAELASAWEMERAKLRDYVEGLSAEGLNRWVEYTTTSGKPQANTLWKALLQVVFHGTQFRAEAGAVMAVMGHSPGDLDFIFFLRESDQR